jgi:hypothetical protein
MERDRSDETVLDLTASGIKWIRRQPWYVKAVAEEGDEDLSVLAGILKGCEENGSDGAVAMPSASAIGLIGLLMENRQSLLGVNVFMADYCGAGDRIGA